MNNTPTIVAADGHVHVYPAYDIKAVFHNLIQNLDRLAGAAGFAESGTIGNGIHPSSPGSPVALDLHSLGDGGYHREEWRSWLRRVPQRLHKLAFLAEGCKRDFFSRLQDQDKAIVANGLEVVSGPDPVCVTVGVRGVGQVCLVAGRQIVTRERLEILGLAMRATIPDGLPAIEVIRRVVEAGGIPVLAWSPGKWLFARGRLVRDLIESDQNRVLRLGDTTLRPTLWSEPRLMKLARERGMTVIPGSDPLPLAGEERFAGTYGFIYQGAFDAERPVTSIRQILTGPDAITPAGERCSPWAIAWRLKRLQAARRSTLSV